MPDGHRSRQDRQVIAGDHRAADALRRAHHQERLEGRREAGQPGRTSEDERPESEDASVTQQVAETPGHQQRAGQRQDVDRDQP
jgi:hypothetical protein